MKRLAITLLSVLCLTGIGRADDLPAAGRVSQLKGGLSVQGADDDKPSYVDRNGIVKSGDVLTTDGDTGRAELEFPHDVWVRLADDTKLELRQVSPAPELRLTSGSVYLDTSDRLRDPIRIATAAGSIQVGANCLVRIDVGNENKVRVTVFRGTAEVSPDKGDSERIKEGRHAYLAPGEMLDGPDRFDPANVDVFDDYNAERAKYVTDHAPDDRVAGLVGGRELQGTGHWVPGQDLWRPDVPAGWRPYSSGYWSNTPGLGLVWVDAAPWGYVTSHYGHWMRIRGEGLFWAPGPDWAPARMVWAHHGEYLGWAPIGDFGVGVWSFYPEASFYRGPAIIVAGGQHQYHSAAELRITEVTRLTIVNGPSLSRLPPGRGIPAEPHYTDSVPKRGIAAEAHGNPVAERPGTPGHTNDEGFHRGSEPKRGIASKTAEHPAAVTHRNDDDFHRGTTTRPHDSPSAPVNHSDPPQRPGQQPRTGTNGNGPKQPDANPSKVNPTSVKPGSGTTSGTRPAGGTRPAVGGTTGGSKPSGMPAPANGQNKNSNGARNKNNQGNNGDKKDK